MMGGKGNWELALGVFFAGFLGARLLVNLVFLLLFFWFRGVFISFQGRWKTASSLAFSVSSLAVGYVNV
jgi:hypothetical protein